MTGGQEEGAPLTVYLSDSITLCVCVCVCVFLSCLCSVFVYFACSTRCCAVVMVIVAYRAQGVN